MSVGSTSFKFGGTVVRFLQFCSAAIIVGIYAYFVYTIRKADVGVPKHGSAVLGVSSAAAPYALCGILFTICLGTSSVFGNLAVIVDILFMHAFGYVAWATRGGTGRCQGYAFTNSRSGPGNQDTALALADRMNSACKYNTVAFAFAIILIFLFLISAVWQFITVRRSADRKRRTSKV